MTDLRKKQIFSKAGLFAVAVIWGSSFIIVKNTVNVLPPLYLIALRFTIAFAVLSAVFFKHYKSIDRQYIISSAIIGFFSFAAYWGQTIGITATTPGKNAFLTTVYCILVPFLYWLVDKTEPTMGQIAAAVLCVVGVGLISLNESFNIEYGDMLTLVGGFFFACQMVAISKFSKNRDILLLVILQFGFCALFCWIYSLIFENHADYAIVDAGTAFSVIYLGIVATALCYLVQNIAQKYDSPSSVSVILSLEAVFGVIFSVALGAEKLTLKIVTGFIFVFTAVLTSELSKHKDISA